MPSGHFSESTGESMAVNTGKLFRTSEPFTQRSRSYCPFTDPTLQPNESTLVAWMYSSHRVGFMQESGCGVLEFLLLRTWWRTRTAVSVYAPVPCSSPDVSTARRGLAASSPLPPLPDRRSMRRGLFRRATALRNLVASWPRRTSFCRSAYL